ncbi:MAG: hypothetical protein K8T10_05425 [Candidatus Eremiobacteraeota bacterium]|nr:hypothetical protein [Candidatus Eremiobacteraeota bacterium]
MGKINSNKDKNESKSDGKQGAFFYWGIIIVFVYLVVSFIAMQRIVRLDFPKTYARGHQHLMYPPSGSGYVAIICLVLMVLFVILCHFLIVRRLFKCKRIVANILIIIIFFSFMEYFLGEYIKLHPTKYRPHSYLIWELVPNQVYDRQKISKKGLRYEEFEAEKMPGEFRFLVIGDSSAFGCGIPDEKRFSDILQDKLQERYPGKKIRVINAALEGYSIYQGRTSYDLRLKKYSPDYLIIGFNNDSSPEGIKDESRTPPKNLRTLFNLLYKSNTFLFIKKQTAIVKEKYLSKSLEKMGFPDETKWRVPGKDIRTHYNHLIDDVKKRGGGVIILSMPLPENEYNSQFPVLRYREIIREIAKNTDSIFIDFYGEWRAGPDNDSFFFDNMHPNIKGHKRIVEEIYREIVERDIVK